MNKVYKAIKENARFLITAHVGPEGDSIGSQLAVAHALKQLGKKFAIVNVDPVPDALEFLPGAKLIKKPSKIKGNFDVALILDCPNIKRIGGASRLIRPAMQTVNIDHHVSNKGFAQITLVDAGKSSTGEILYHLFKKLGVKLDYKIALCLYTAIVTDTGLFRYSNTKAATLKVAGELCSFGINPKQVCKALYESDTLVSRRLLAEVLPTLTVEKGGEIAWMEMTPAMLSKAKAKVSDAEDFVNYARFLKGVRVALLFSTAHKKGQVKVSLRSNDKTDVNTIAGKFGGGGHSSASGCIARGSLDSVRKKVLMEVKKWMA